MPVFKLRNRVEILRQMVARVVARSELQKLRRNSVVFHILAAAANEDANIYFQLARLRELFSIDKASGSDLDERAREIQPGTITRVTEIYSTTVVQLSRPGTVGTILIPAGSVVAASDGQGKINYSTIAAVSITPGNTLSAAVGVISAIAGARANVSIGEINQLVTRVPGVTGVSNPSAATNGRDRELDDQFRQRIKDHVNSLSRGTLKAIEAFARAVRLSTGQTVLFSKVVKPIVPTGFIFCYIDDGSGSAETSDSTFVGGIPEEDVILAAAAGGETELLTNQRPIRDDPALIFRVNDVVVIRGTDWEIDPTRGQIELLPAGAFPAGLTTGDKAAANYRYYTGLIAEVQRVITGDPSNPITYPGVEAGGITTLVRAATADFQTLTSKVTALQGFELDQVSDEIRTVIQSYINSLGIGEAVILSEIIQRAMGVSGVYNFKVLTMNGSTPADQTVLPNKAARAQTGDITVN